MICLGRAHIRPGCQLQQQAPMHITCTAARLAALAVRMIVRCPFCWCMLHRLPPNACWPVHLHAMLSSLRAGQHVGPLKQQLQVVQGQVLSCLLFCLSRLVPGSVQKAQAVPCAACEGAWMSLCCWPGHTCPVMVLCQLGACLPCCEAAKVA